MNLILNGTADGLASAMFTGYWKQGCCSLIKQWGGAYGASGIAVLEVYEL